MSWSSVRQCARHSVSPPRVLRVPNLAQYVGTWANRMNNVHFPPASLLHARGEERGRPALTEYLLYSCYQISWRKWAWEN